MYNIKLEEEKALNYIKNMSGKNQQREEFQHPRDEDVGFDKGPPLQNDTLEYFKQIMIKLEEKNAFEDEEDKEMFLNNVFDELKGREYRLSVNKRGSTILEKLLSTSLSQHIRLFMFRLTDMWYQLCIDRNSSHVLQVLIRRIPAILIEEAQQPDDKDSSSSSSDSSDDENSEEEEKEVVPSMSVLLRQVCEELQDSYQDLMFNPHGSYILRDLLRILGGKNNFEIKHKLASRGFVSNKPTQIAKQVFTPFNDILTNVVARVLNSEDLTSACINPVSVPVNNPNSSPNNPNNPYNYESNKYSIAMMTWITQIT